jgi:hypothetical protein
LRRTELIRQDSSKLLPVRDVMFVRCDFLTAFRIIVRWNHQEMNGDE